MNARAAGEQLALVSVDADRATSNARSLVALMGGTIYGAVQRDGAYSGARHFLSTDDLRRHFAGEHAVAIQGVSGTGRNATSRFFAWDIDERAEERFPILARVLARHGFLEHAIRTGGSDAGRGKVIVFTNPIQAQHACDFAFSILEQAKREIGWGIEVRASESRPTASTGGLLRIGGRNPKRNGPIEGVCRLDTGFPVSLSQVARANYDVPLEPRPVARPRVAPYIATMLNSGLPWPSDGSKGVLRTLTRMAVFAVRSGYAKTSFDSWAGSIHKKSPWLDAPTPTNKDARGVRWDRVAKAAWAAGSTIVRTSKNKQKRILHLPEGEREGFSPDVISTFGYVPRLQTKTHDELGRVETALLDMLRVRDLHADAFSFSYAELGDVVGMKPPHVHRLVRILAAQGRVVIVDRGTQGVNGLKTIYALPQGRTLEDVVAAASRRPVMKLRMAKRAAYEVVQSAKMVDIASIRERRSLPPISPVREGALVAAHGDEEGRPPRAAARLPVALREGGRRRTKSGRGGGEPHEAICGCSECRRPVSAREPTT